ncbi:hypothetical protein HPB47_003991 [Ixodes persulcatus]|uniref:Uncharacterized protein n=1 Tax=Ixodes persulcatus TaxID=34615 RepID=A0AC60PHI3_IXOPE|nr:hypothetical protein HPB47_003991 [Ixodes persulcatus]
MDNTTKFRRLFLRLFIFKEQYPIGHTNRFLKETRKEFQNELNGFQRAPGCDALTRSGAKFKQVSLLIAMPVLGKFYATPVLRALARMSRLIAGFWNHCCEIMPTGKRQLYDITWLIFFVYFKFQLRNRCIRYRAGVRFIYTAEEKALLQALVTKHARAQLKAWEKLSTEYNRQSNVRPRSTKQLEKRWKNEKSRYKKTKSDETRDIHSTGGEPQTSRKMSPSLILAGAAAEHMATQVDRPVLSLPPAAVFEAMVRGTEDDEITPAGTTCQSSVGDACATPPAKGMTCPRAELPSGASRKAECRIAAWERVLAPEKEARVAILERKDRRKEAQHLIEIRILRNKLFEKRRRGRVEFQLLKLERKIKAEQLVALRCKQQGCGNHD